jgi:hypothetical protein
MPFRTRALLCCQWAVRLNCRKTQNATRFDWTCVVKCEKPPCFRLMSIPRCSQQRLATGLLTLPFVCKGLNRTRHPAIQDGGDVNLPKWCS